MFFWESLSTHPSEKESHEEKKTLLQDMCLIILMEY